MDSVQVDAFERHCHCAQVSRRMEGWQRMTDEGFKPFARMEGWQRIKKGEGATYGNTIWVIFSYLAKKQAGEGT